MADQTAINRFRYAGFDFETHEDELRARLQVQFASSFNDFSVSSLGIVLLDAFAFGLDTSSFYLDRRATDSLLATARTRDQIANITRQLGYKMSGAAGSSIDLSVAASQAYNFDITIPAGFQFQGPNSTVFQVGQPTTITANSTSAVTVSCYQGQTQTESFVSDGTANQVFILSKVTSTTFLAIGTVTVTINSASWTESDFITFDATNQFEVGYNNEPPTIRFGNGIAGNIPPAGAVISVSYVTTMGEAGQVAATSTWSVVSPLVVNFTNINLTISNSLSSVGGVDREDLEHARAYAPKFKKTRQYAVVQQDYETLAGSYVHSLYGRVAAAQAVSARSAATDTALINLLNSTTSAVTTGATAVQTGVVSANAALTDMATQLSNGSAPLGLQQLLTNITNAINQAGFGIGDNYTNVLKPASDSIATQSGVIAAAYTTASSAATSLNTAINAISGGAGSDQFQTATKNALISYLTALLGALASITSAQSTLSTQSTNLATGLTGTVSPRLTSLGAIGSPGTYIGDADTRRLAIVTDRTTIATAVTSISSNATLAQSTVQTNCDSVFTHVDSLLAADCQANLISVSILSRDSNGFYAAPSIGLQAALEAYLDTIKETTQTVSVTSGASNVFPAVLSVELGVLTSGNQAQAKAQAIATIQSLLKDRAFGLSLHPSDLIPSLMSIPGVSHADVTILGSRPLAAAGAPTPPISTANLDDGDLIIGSHQVVSLSQIAGDLTVTTVSVPITS